MKRFLATVCATLWVLPSALYAQGLGASQLILTNSSGGGVILQPDPAALPPLQPLLITPPPAAGHQLVYTPAWTLNRLVKWTNAAAPVLGNSLISDDGTTVEIGNGNLSITNTDGTARELRLYEPSGAGTNYTAFRAQAQAGNITYTLPASLTPTSTVAAGILQTDGSGNLSWVDPSALVSAAGWALTGNSITSAWNGSSGNFLGTTNAQPLVIATTNTTTPQPIQFWTNNTERMRITDQGHVLPGADNTYNLGSPTDRWANLYAYNGQVSNDLTVSNTLNVGNGIVVAANGATIVGNSSITGDLTVTGHVLPGADNQYDLGSSGARWREVHGVDLYATTGQVTDLTVSNTLNVGNGAIIVGDLSTSGGTVAFSATATITGVDPTIPDGVVVVEIDGGSGTVTLPSGTQGQLLFIRRYNASGNLTLPGVEPNGSNFSSSANFHAILMYIGGAWRLMSVR